MRSLRPEPVRPGVVEHAAQQVDSRDALLFAAAPGDACARASVARQSIRAILPLSRRLMLKFHDVLSSPTTETSSMSLAWSSSRRLSSASADRSQVCETRRIHLRQVAYRRGRVTARARRGAPGAARGHAESPDPSRRVSLPDVRVGGLLGQRLRQVLQNGRDDVGVFAPDGVEDQVPPFSADELEGPSRPSKTPPVRRIG